MKNHWRFLGLILVLVLMILTIGCNDVGKAPNSDNGEKMTISWTAWLGAPVEKDAEMIEYWNKEFNVNIEVLNIEPTSYEETIGLKIASGEVPDVLWLPSVITYNKYAKDGILCELTEELIKKNAPQMYEEYINTEPNVFSYRKVNGKIYGIPSIGTSSRRPLVYRGDWMQKLGVEKTPETLAEFENLMYRFAKGDPDGNGKKDTYGMSASGVYAVYGAFGIVPEFWMVGDSGELVYGGVQPEMKEALEIMRRWYADGVIDPEFIITEKQNSSSNMSVPFVNGKIGFTANGEAWHFKPKFDVSTEAEDWEGDNVKELRKIDPVAADSLRMGIPLTGPTGKQGIGASSALGTEGSIVAIGVQVEEQPEKLKKILNMINTIGFSTRENLLTAQYGIQGKHWVFNEQGQIEFLDEKYQLYTERAKIGAHTVMASLKSLQWNHIGKEAVRQWSIENQASLASIENLLKVVLPSQNLYKTELDKICTETYIALITGDRPMSYFDDFVSLWKKSGGDILTKEANEWYSSIK